MNIKPNTYKAIYRLLDRVSPLDTDCGLLCDAACCMDGSGEDTGIFLLPGEEAIHNKEDWAIWEEDDAAEYNYPDSWDRLFFVKCKGPKGCNRTLRPIQCRSFPLLPHIKPDGELILVYNDVDLPYGCPLIDDEIPLNDDFVQATLTVWKHLIRDQRIYDLVLEDSLDRGNE